MFNNTVVAVCGHYVCDYDGNYGYSGEKYTQVTWCNNKVQCYNGGVDEKYCTVEEKFQCRDLHSIVWGEISTSRVCDRKCDCSYCDDEWNCNGYNYHYWYKCSNSSRSIPSYYICDNYADCYHGDDESNCGNVTTCITGRYSIPTYMLTNYSRCTPWVECDNKLDQTNCSDSTLAPLQCPVGGYTSIVSEHIICKSIVYAAGDIHHSNTSAVCDDGMDVQCVTPTPVCYIHKHQLCDSVTDCKGGSDERSSFCSSITSKSCMRKYPYKKSLKLPRDWIGDGVEDCVGGIDEWEPCSQQCEDAYICPSGYPLYVEIPILCDESFSCEGGNGICKTSGLSSSQTTYNPGKVEDVNYLNYCLLGLQDMYPQHVLCEHAAYPIYILGTHPNYLYLPIKQVNCEYVYGEPYVYLSYSGKCYNTKCPLSNKPLSRSTCSHIRKRKTYSISSSGNLVFVEKHGKGFKMKNIFVCGNGICVPYNKLCNLIDDCGDGIDEDNCDNRFDCNVKSNFSKSYIQLSSVCDGQYDCLDSSDEKYCCHRKLINGLSLKISAWLIGTLAFLRNDIIQVRSVRTMRLSRTSSALTDKVLIT